MKASVATLACAVCACLLTPPSALAGANDVAATRAYLRASYAYDRAIDREAAVDAAAVRARAGQIAGECPSALTYAPRDAAFRELGEEITATLYGAREASTHSQALGFAGAIGHLRWSDRRLTRLVHAQAAGERASATIALPDICGDIAGWKASAYATLPPASTQFIARLRAIEALYFVGFIEQSRETIIMRLLRRYEGSAERRAAGHIERLELRVETQAAAAVAAARSTLAPALGVSAL